MPMRGRGEPSDRRRLVAALVARDESAWSRFIREHAPIVQAVAAGFGFSAEDRHDLFQGAWLAALRSVDRLRDPNRLASWVYSIAHRLAIDMIRKRREVSLLQDGEKADPLGAMLVEPTVIEELARIEDAARVRDLLGRLDRRCRILLQRLYLEEPQPSYERIAREEGIPIGSIGPTRARCLEKAQKLLATLSKEPCRPSTLRSREERRTGFPMEER